MPIWTFVAIGLASYYDMPGAPMANGDPFDPSAHTCAMRAEPFGERVEIVNADNGKHSWCVVTDRGPFVPGRVIDVSPAVQFDLEFGGLASVRVYRVVGQMPRCAAKPTPTQCKTPPQSCILDLPKPVLVKC